MPQPTPLQRVHTNTQRITQEHQRLTHALATNDHRTAAAALAWIANDAERLANAARDAEQRHHDAAHEARRTAADNGARLADELARTILPDDN